MLRVTLAILLALGACATKEYGPIHSALLGTTAETIVYNDYLIHQTGVLSLASNLGAVALGDVFYLPEKGGPETAVGLGWSQSHVSFFETDVPDEWVVVDLRNLLDELQRQVAKNVRLTADLGAARAQLQETRASRTRTQIADRIKKLERERESGDRLLEYLSRQVEERSNVPGVIVARWSARRDLSAGLSLLPIASASGRKQVQQDGFVVLGGLRIGRFSFGDDAREMYDALSPDEQATLQYLGVVTYVLQARLLAFTAAENLSAQFQFALSAIEGGRAIRSIETAKLELYASYLSQLSARGTLGSVHVTRRPVDMTKKDDFRDVGRTWSYGWNTLHTQFTRAKSAFWATPELYGPPDG